MPSMKEAMHAFIIIAVLRTSPTSNSFRPLFSAILTVHLSPALARQGYVDVMRVEYLECREDTKSPGREKVHSWREFRFALSKEGAKFDCVVS